MEINPEAFTYNEFKLHPSTIRWMDYPIALLPELVHLREGAILR